MRTDSATTRRVRLVTILSVAAAVTVMLGAILVVASVVMRILTRYQPAHLARLGLDVVTADGAASDLIVVGSQAGAPGGRVALSGFARSVLDASRGSVLVVPAGKPVPF